MSGSVHRLAAYGSLGPGGPNHHVVEDLGGRWIDGSVRGVLYEDGWGADLGFPGIRLDRSAPEVRVVVLESAALESAWIRLDRFEGPGYRRTTTVVTTAEGELEASIYELAPAAGR